MNDVLFKAALEVLRQEYLNRDWTYHDSIIDGQNTKLYLWPGLPDEDVIVVVHQSNGRHELFHRHNYFYINYTFKGEYDSLSHRYDNKITIREGELYAGQPLAGHALNVHSNQKTIIIGILIRQDVFSKALLPFLSCDTKLFHFFLDPETTSFSDEYLHFKPDNKNAIIDILRLMVIEYANRQEDTQIILKPLALSFLTQLIRQYTRQYRLSDPSLEDRILRYISAHSDSVTLQTLANHFSYNPNYISTILRRKLGKSFSELVLEQRMNRAVVLLRGTNLSVEEAASILGYKDSSSFYRVFREYYHMSPREYLRKH